ncbi:kynurenine--oxoglutarate transaminase 3 [Nasonia vitripennis]|uniref:Aminotransferase class I/classII large domain-containing protein n=1 Tax=Nasonia vitripennis TaxID=7425 RepID=A0A7M7IX25_NASVI|nr:kynurenine--oxoglutarate transaminase 3 [Nasonia vitripennis]
MDAFVLFLAEASAALRALFKMLTQTKWLLTMADKFEVPERFKSNEQSVFEAFNDLVEQYHPVDLGQGAPDFNPPLKLRSAMSKIMLSGDAALNQYTRDYGHPRLVNAIGKYYSKLLNRILDPYNNIFITVGATEALFLSLQTHTNPGDEWIIIEPYYDPYLKMVKDALGVARFIALKPNKLNGTITSDDWTFDRQELRNLFNVNTKGIIVNTPNNPIGKVFTLDELTFIADLAKKWDTLVIFDEVYQFLTFNNKKHIRIATLPGMFERTISIGSGGKAFSATGWRLGWVYGGAKILSNLRALQTNVVMSVPTSMQEAFAIIFEDELRNFGKSNSYLTSFNKLVESKKSYIIKGLTELGMTVIVPDGGYFVVANWTTLAHEVNITKKTTGDMDTEFIKWMIKNVKVLGFPFASFFDKNDKHIGEGGIRFAYVKKKKTLKNAIELMSKWGS